MLKNAIRTREMLNALLEIGRAENDCFSRRTFDPITSMYQALLEVIERDAPDLFEEIKSIEHMDDRIACLSKRGIRIDIAPSAQGVTIEQDQTKFIQIVGNLLKNGFYYRRRFLLVHLSCLRDKLSIAVRDDGPGIAPEHHDAIFERYKQVMPSAEVARSGHGLGLAVARILARSMGGDITIDSELGLGALFNFVIPITPALSSMS
jgi:signal transduction histidine kinase